MHRELQPDETEIRGEWLAGGGQIIEDAECERVKWGSPMLRAISASEAKSKYGVPLLLFEAQQQQQQ
jgi:hypothetical protein